MPGLFGGAGPSGSGTTAQPQANTAQVYIPQNQPGQDANYQAVLQQMLNPALAGLQQISGNPATQIYPQVQQVAGGLTQPGALGGSFGPYGSDAINAAQQANQGYANLQAQGQGPLAYGQFSGGNLQPAFGQVSGAAFNPLYQQAVGNIAQNPFFSGAVQAAQQGQQIGQAATAGLPGQISALQGLGYSLPGAAQQTAGQTGAGIPQLQQLGAGAGQLGGGLAGAAAGLGPQLQQLFGQLVPQLAGAAPQYAQAAGATTPQLQQLYQSLVPSLAQAGGQFAAQAGATNPQLQQIAGLGQGLAGQAGGYAQAAQAGGPQAQQIYGQGQGLAGAAPGYAQQAQALTPYLEGLIGGQTIPGMQALAQQSAQLAPQFAQQALQTIEAGKPIAQSLLQTGFDPQSALYNRTAGQLRDQQQAVNAMSGVGTSPYGAGVTGRTLENFNIDWQNQQLGRELQTAQGLGQLASAIPGLQAQALGGLGTAQQQLGATTPQALALAQQQLAGTQAGAGILGNLTQGGGDLGLSALQQQLAGTQAGGGLLNQLTQGGAGLGLQSAQQQLANTLGGAGAYGNLLQAAGGLGQGLSAQQLANVQAGGGLLGNLAGQAGQLGGQLTSEQLNTLIGSGNIYNQGAQTAGALAGQVGGLSGQQLQQLLQGAQGAQGLFQGGLGLGQGGAQLAAQAGALPAALYTGQQQDILNALQQQTGAAATGAGALGGLAGALGQAGQQQLQGLQAQAQFGALPYQQAQQQGMNALQALTQQANLGNAQFQLPQQVLQNLQSYLGLGQSASQISGQLGQLGVNQGQQGALGLGLGGLLAAPLLFGSPAEGAATSGLFGSGGFGSALGLGAGAGLSGLFGGGGNALFNAFNAPQIAGTGSLAGLLGGSGPISAAEIALL